MNLCTCGCGKEVTKEGNNYLVGHNAYWKGRKNPAVTLRLTGRKHSEKTKRLLSERMKNNHPNRYFLRDWNREHPRERMCVTKLDLDPHVVAWKKFGQDRCEVCGKVNGSDPKNYRLSMHCTSSPKDYSIMKRRNWLTTCKSCHYKWLEYGRGKINYVNSMLSTPKAKKIKVEKQYLYQDLMSGKRMNILP